MPSDDGVQVSWLFFLLLLFCFVFVRGGKKKQKKERKKNSTTKNIKISKFFKKKKKKKGEQKIFDFVRQIHYCITYSNYTTTVPTTVLSVKYILLCV